MSEKFFNTARNKVITVLSLCMLIILPIIVGAAKVTAGERIDGYLKDVKRPTPSLGMVYLEVEGKTAYCIDYNYFVPSDGQTYEELFKHDNTAYSIMMQGYSKDRKTGNLGLKNWKEAYYATQTALWLYISSNEEYKTEFKLELANIKPLNDRGTAVLDKAKEILDKAKKNPVTNDIKVNLTIKEEDKTPKIKDGKRVIGPVNVVTDAVEGTLTVALENAPANAKLIDEAGQDKTKFEKKDLFFVQIDDTNTALDFSIVAKGTLKKPTAFALKAENNPKQQKVLAPIMKEINKDAWAKLPIKIERPFGYIEVLKVDAETKKAIPGVEFGLYSGETEIQKLVTDNNGIAKSNALDFGKYTLKELKPAPGYAPTQKTWDVTVSELNKTYKVEVVNNKAKGKLELTKKDISTGELLPNAGFKIRNEKKEVVVEGRTDKNGLATFELPIGKYTYQEFDAPPGYIIDEKEYPFEIKASGEIVKCVMTNKKQTGKLELTKKDISTGELLPNAGFKIRNEKKEVVVEGRTDKNGLATFELPIGKYTYQEFDAPEGYVVDESEFPFEIKENGEIVKCIMTNKMIEGELEITKVDVADGTLLPNTTFAIYDKDKKELIKGVTDNNGIAKFKLKYGKYFYQEISAPEGYIIDNALYPFEIKKNGEIVKAKMTNRKLPKTGDVSRELPIAIGISIMAIIGLCIVFIKTRRK